MATDKKDKTKSPKAESPKAAAASKPAAAAPAKAAAPKSAKTPAAAPKAPPSNAGASRAVPPPPPSKTSFAAIGEIVADDSAHKPHGFRRKMVGRVRSDKMDKTVTVEVIRNALDPVYKKYIRVRERYKAHDETNQYKTGDRVEIQEHRPISRDKRWMVTRLIARAVEE